VPAVDRASAFIRLRSSKFRKYVGATSRRRLQNVIASDAGRESLAGDSLDSHRIRLVEALVRVDFPNFFSRAIPCSPTTSPGQLQSCLRALRRF